MTGGNGYTRVDNTNLERLIALPGKAAAVYLALLSHRNQKTGLCNPAQTTIADECDIDTRQARRLIKQLDNAGLITWATQTSRKGRSSNKYLFPTPTHPQVEDTDVPNPPEVEDIHDRRLRTSMSPPKDRTSMSPKQRRSQQDEDLSEPSETSERYIPTECTHIYHHNTCTKCGQTQLRTATTPN